MAIAAIFAGGILAWSGIKGYQVSLLTQDLLSGKDPKTDPRLTTTQESVTASGLFAPIGSAIGGGIGSAIAGALNPANLLSAAGTATAKGGVTSTGGSVGGSNAANKSLGQRMVAAVGWKGAEWIAFNNIVMAESGWSSTIVNPHSPAAGIAQNINGFGPGYQRGNAAQQIAWMIRYIRQRYGDPINAWRYHQIHGNY